MLGRYKQRRKIDLKRFRAWSLGKSIMVYRIPFNRTFVTTNLCMQTTDADLDKVLNYLSAKIDFQSDVPFEQNKDNMTDLLIDLRMNYENLKKVLEFYESGDYIKDLLIHENGYSFIPWHGLHDLYEEGGFEALQQRGQ